MAYEETVEHIRQLIAGGETYQVNFTFRLRRPFYADPWQFFIDLIDSPPPPYAAYVETDTYAVCSASPELFFALQGNEIVARPMKGTTARGRWYAEDIERSQQLAASEKNRAENAMIVDMMRNDLGRIAHVGSVEVKDLFRVERYPTLWQMTSRVSATSDAPLTEILAATFPCASVTGAPKPRTMQIIAANETTPRRIYTGSIGMMLPGRKAKFNVAIRTVLVDKQRQEAEYGVGGGVVWDSTPQDEYRECLLKSRILAERRPAFQLLETLLWTPSDGYAFLEEHLRRLSDSAEYFLFPPCIARVSEELNRIAKILSPVAHRIRLLVSREGEITCEHFPLNESELPDPIRLELASSPIDVADPFLYHKTTHRKAYDLASSGCQAGDDVLLYNRRGEVTETCRANIVLRCGSDYLTPRLDCGLLAGTHRARLLAGGKIREQVIPLPMLLECDELIFVNSLRGWRRACLVGSRDPRAIAQELQGED